MHKMFNPIEAGIQAIQRRQKEFITHDNNFSKRYQWRPFFYKCYHRLQIKYSLFQNDMKYIPR